MLKGFSLVSTLLVTLLFALLCLVILSLSTSELKTAQIIKHQDIAESNARLALAVAIGELQKHTGSDQCVTANAAILETDELLANRNWLGVWSTAYEVSGRSWPLIGKQEKGSPTETPYSQEGALEDLRHTIPSLGNGAWRKTQHQSWLVSTRSKISQPEVALSLDDQNILEILGKGTLGNHTSNDAYLRDRVLVEKVDITGQGAYAWYISDHSQKATIAAHGNGSPIVFEAAAQGNPENINSEDGTKLYQGFGGKVAQFTDVIFSYASVALVDRGDDLLGLALKENYHDFTVSSSGLFTDTLMSGLRYDLTPLLFAKKGGEGLSFQSADGNTSFSSNYPIIPGPSHAVLSPSFGALRDWGRHMHTGLGIAEVSFSKDSVRMRPTTNWPYGISDGACADMSKWAESAPKIHPVMTDVRWHYYFSHHNNRIRTHIIPRVCLWNPYNRDLEVSDLSVLMPNPFHDVSHGIHFFPEDSHVEEDLKPKYASDGTHPFTRWGKRGGYAGGDVYKLRMNPFPVSRYLAFVLKKTTMKAGECHVFSPQVTNPSVVSHGIGIQEYETEDVSENILSSDSAQGGSHFYYDYLPDVSFSISGNSWYVLESDLVAEIDFSTIKDYQPELSTSSVSRVDSFPFILKSGIASTLTDLYTSADYVTLQLINNGAGGAKSSKSFYMQGEYWGSANQRDGSFGLLQTFAENPLKDAGQTHQIGAKMLWLDETFNEGDLAPYRHGTNSKQDSRWASDHMVYNPCSIANWNIRAQLTSRSPVSQCGKKFYLNSTGPWVHQFMPSSPQDVNDMPTLNHDGTAFVKNPFGLAVHFSQSPNVKLFDLPSEQYGALSLATLRHAMLSPYSWSPTYLIGHSLRDLHAPAGSTAHSVAVLDHSAVSAPTRWDYLLGASEGGLSHGAYTQESDSQGLMQLGTDSVSRAVGQMIHSSEDEILAYDIAYEVNHYLWDRFFLSSMPIDESGETFDWHPRASKTLWNQGYEFNGEGSNSYERVIGKLAASDGLNTGFWRNAEFLNNTAAFNVNSTSVDAWVAVLSGTLGVSRPLEEGSLAADQVSYSRYRKPSEATNRGDAHPDDLGAWNGGGLLTAGEVQVLAENIVNEVCLRGPFISIADFVNRRLSHEDDNSSKMGVIDAAIEESKLNSEFIRNPEYRSSVINSGSDPLSKDNNLKDFSESYRYEVNGEIVTSQPTSQAWGLPSFLTQSDVLEPIAPSFTARGDTFTIRCYGDSSGKGGVIRRAWLEAVVERSPDYVEHSSNKPTDSAQRLDYASGEYVEGELSEINKKFGRKYRIKSFRWLSKDEI